MYEIISTFSHANGININYTDKIYPVQKTNRAFQVDLTTLVFEFYAENFLFH